MFYKKSHLLQDPTTKDVHLIRMDMTTWNAGLGHILKEVHYNFNYASYNNGTNGPQKKKIQTPLQNQMVLKIS